MRAIRRGVAGSIGAIAVAALLVGCTPGMPAAWQLHDDGTVSFAECYPEAARLTVFEYRHGGQIVARFANAGARWAPLDGTALSVGDIDGWLTASDITRLEEWDTVQVTFYDAYPRTEEQYLSLEALDYSSSSSVKRDELKEGEWVWIRGWNTAEIECDIRDDAIAVADAMDPIAFKSFLAEHPGTAAVRQALIDSRSPELWIAFHSRLLTELHAHWIDGQDLPTTVNSALGAGFDGGILTAAPAAARTMGFDWSPDLSDLSSWARVSFGPQPGFEAGMSVFDLADGLD
jgi:hypothetical protein